MIKTQVHTLVHTQPPSLRPALKKILLAMLMLLMSIFTSPLLAKSPLKVNNNAVAVEAYIYLYPLVLMDITRLQTTNVEHWDGKGFAAPMNTYANFRAYPPLNFTAIVRPNFDTLYSSLWLDLTKGPMVLTIPDSQGRYYLWPALDMWTDVFASPGWRTTGTKAGNYVYVPPGWNGILPKGLIRVNAPTPYIWFIGRTQTNGKKDYKVVHKFQDGLKITPLADWGKKDWKAPAGKVDSSVDMKTPPLEQVAKMSGEQFFEYATKLLKLFPPHTTDFSQIARLARIGIVPGKNLNFDKLSPSIQKALDTAPAKALKQMQQKAANIGTKRNGWQVTLDTIGVYGNNYLQRAAVAMIGLGANQPGDAIYPVLFTDANGKPLLGNKKYQLHFNKNELPPAKAFWSITIYSKDGFPIPNAMNRANLSSWMPLVYNKDGSLDVYFQNSSPGKAKQANWLPTPKQGPWTLAMRLYAPEARALNGKWAPPVIQKINTTAGN